MSRGLKNNNPGNIEKNSDKFQGEALPSQDIRFKQFKSMPYGYRAMFVTLHTYLVKYGRNTIEKIINAWAPSVENHTENYIKAVERWSGVPRNKVLNASDGHYYKKIVAAMSRMENGVPAISSEVEAGFMLQNKIK